MGTRTGANSVEVELKVEEKSCWGCTLSQKYTRKKLEWYINFMLDGTFEILNLLLLLMFLPFLFLFLFFFVYEVLSAYIVQSSLSFSLISFALFFFMALALALYFFCMALYAFCTFLSQSNTRVTRGVCVWCVVCVVCVRVVVEWYCIKVFVTYCNGTLSWKF